MDIKKPPLWGQMKEELVKALAEIEKEAGRKNYNSLSFPLKIDYPHIRYPQEERDGASAFLLVNPDKTKAQDLFADLGCGMNGGAGEFLDRQLGFQGSSLLADYMEKNPEIADLLGIDPEGLPQGAEEIVALEEKFREADEFACDEYDQYKEDMWLSIGRPPRLEIGFRIAGSDSLRINILLNDGEGEIVGLACRDFPLPENIGKFRECLEETARIAFPLIYEERDRTRLFMEKSLSRAARDTRSAAIDIASNSMSWPDAEKSVEDDRAAAVVSMFVNPDMAEGVLRAFGRDDEKIKELMEGERKRLRLVSLQGFLDENPRAAKAAGIESLRISEKDVGPVEEKLKEASFRGASFYEKLSAYRSGEWAREDSAPRLSLSLKETEEGGYLDMRIDLVNADGQKIRLAGGPFPAEADAAEFDKNVDGILKKAFPLLKRPEFKPAPIGSRPKPKVARHGN